MVTRLTDREVRDLRDSPTLQKAQRERRQVASPSVAIGLAGQVNVATHRRGSQG